MKKFFTAIRNIWNHEELRKKILFTLGILLVYRIGSYVLLPGIDAVKMEDSSAAGSGSIADFLGLFTGGAFNRASIFALGVMPYISASIVIQLLYMMHIDRK